ncbi:hypothetical protein H2200_010618 [Cladophialophora chaetospira]|uniref:AB hydrolase-1 domain-containing protein n=1 Tax=Cladophialophora chaetospira TaxID=386627 RepID=A0AA39CEE4_9EURO|nr:hypothetical protein H2200_010618 [Cladophialophora chaetospira]
MTKPSIIFVPGSFNLPSEYKVVFDGVSEAGYEIKGIHLPTVGAGPRQGRDGPAPSMYDDAAFIAQEIEELADQGKDVVVIGHSYAGVPMSQCSKGLDKEERKAHNKPGGIVRLAYIACLVPALGESAQDVISTGPKERRIAMAVDDDGWMLIEDPPAAARALLQHVTPEEGEAIVRRWAKHSAPSFGDPLTYAGYKDIPASYLICEEDLAGPVEIIQVPKIEIIEKVSGRKVDTTSIKTGHMPNVTAVKETVEWIVSVAEKVEKS